VCESTIENQRRGLALRGTKTGQIWVTIGTSAGLIWGRLRVNRSGRAASFHRAGLRLLLARAGLPPSPCLPLLHHGAKLGRHRCQWVECAPRGKGWLFLHPSFLGWEAGQPQAKTYDRKNRTTRTATANREAPATSHGKKRGASFPLVSGCGSG
jgi:hypothetical protein